MKTLAKDRQDLIDALVAEPTLGGITAGLLEKDEHLTDALRALFAVPLEGMQLVFCGGTSLSKAHGLIERMSEDADLKVVPAPTTQALSRTKIRSRLSALKATLSEALCEIGLLEDTVAAQALNENHYFGSEWIYQKKYESVAGLRPHLRIELTVRAPVLQTVQCPIGSLANRLAGRPDDVFLVPTVAIAETLAEKVLTFLRRFAQHRAGLFNQPWDPTLVRHIYDTHCIQLHRADVLPDAVAGFGKLVLVDQSEFGNQFPNFAKSALSVLTQALEELRTDARTQREYEQNLLPLIYGNVRPPYQESFKSFEAVAKALLATLSE